MSALTLPLKLGHKYRRRNGSVAIVLQVTPTGTAWCNIDSDVLAESGRVPNGLCHPHDIVEDYVGQSYQPKGHPHAASMLLYAQDAAETDKPWERWEYLSTVQARWKSLQETNPRWDLETQYRRIPRTIRIGEFDVPEPLRTAPEPGQHFYVTTILHPKQRAEGLSWRGNDTQQHWLRAGVLHLTSEAAELHARALLSLTQS